MSEVKKVYRAGGSLFVLLPSKKCKALGIKENDNVIVKETKKGFEIVKKED